MIYLHGGGWQPDESAWTGQFVREAAARAGGPPVVVVILWAETADEGEPWHADYRDDLTGLGCGEVRIVQLAGDELLDAAHLEAAHGIFVGGGLTPAYHRALQPAAAAIRARVLDDGVPYLGMSAGASIAGDVALLGGWRLGGVPVAPEDAAEGLDEVSLAPGLGLVRPVVEVHVGRGLLARPAALAASGLISDALGVDEDTVAVVAPDGSYTVAGLGAVWELRAGRGHEIAVGRRTATAF